MPRDRIIKLPVKNVTASGIVRVELPVGEQVRIKKLLMRHGYGSGTNTIAAACTNLAQIRLILNEDVYREVTGTQLRDINLFNGTQYDVLASTVPNTAPGVLHTMFFEEPWRRIQSTREGTALPMVWQGGMYHSARLEIELGAASTPTLDVEALVEDFVGSEEPRLMKYIRGVWAGVDPETIEFLPARDILTQLSLYPAGGSVALDNITVQIGSANRPIDRLSAISNKALLTNNDMTPAASGRTASIYDIVTDPQDLFNPDWDLGRIPKVQVTARSATTISGSITWIMQRWGRISGDRTADRG